MEIPPARWASLHGFPRFCCRAFPFAPCSSCVVTHWGLGSPWLDLPWHLPHPKWTSRANCVSGQLSQLEHLGASKDAGEQLMSLSALRGLGHGKNLFRIGKMEILAGKEGKITPQRVFPLGIWGAKIRKAQHGLTQVFPVFPVRSFQWLTGVSNVPLVIDREGN